MTGKMIKPTAPPEPFSKQWLADFRVTQRLRDEYFDDAHCQPPSRIFETPLERKEPS